MGFKQLPADCCVFVKHGKKVMHDRSYYAIRCALYTFWDSGGTSFYVRKPANKRDSVFEANPDEFKLLATNQLGDEVYASPIVSGDRLYLRVAFKDDERQEFLYAIGTK